MEDKLRQMLDYCPVTGTLSWKIPPRRGVSAGPLRASPKSDGYLRVGIDGKQFLAHRVAWLLTYGQWPQQHIDHINGDRADNRACNLRVVSRSENNQNLQMAKRNNKSGLLGAHYYSSRDCWESRIMVNGVKTFLGYFDTAQEAHEAYMIAKSTLHNLPYKVLNANANN